MVNNQKMSKSLGNFYTVDDLKKNNIEPLAIRYLFLQSHYRQLLNFTWESTKSSQEALNKLKNVINELKNNSLTRKLVNSSTKLTDYKKQFAEALSNDLQIPRALAIMWEMLKSDLPPQEKLDLLFDFDKVFGLRLGEVREEKIPEEIIKLAEQRKLARQNKDFKKSDELRIKIESKGFGTLDTKEGYKIKKI